MSGLATNHPELDFLLCLLADSKSSMLCQAFRNTACFTRLTFRQAEQNLVFLPVSEADNPPGVGRPWNGKMLSDFRLLRKIKID
jgi:hypothetical protein